MSPPLVPSWAPNVHPMIIHFPIVLAFLALLIDAVQAARPRSGLGGFGSLAFVLGAVAAGVAYLTGHEAAETVLVPGMAHGLVNDHLRWALGTTSCFVVLAAFRVAGHVLRLDKRRGWALACVASSLLVAILVEQTAERGARLVFEQGIGVEAGPADRPGR